MMFPVSRLLLIVFTVLWLIGCDSATDRPIVVEFWAMGQEGEQVKALLPEFERHHPDIRIRNSWRCGRLNRWMSG